jgi:hypothetical protein
MKSKKHSITIILILTGFFGCQGGDGGGRTSWIDEPQEDWPQIAMVNEINYVDQYHPVAGCAFLLDTGADTLAVTAKHVLIYFKSEAMDAVSFGNTLVSWTMHPKDNPADSVVAGRLINEDPTERIEYSHSATDWLLFEVAEMSPHIEPLKFREKPLVEGERVFIVGWRYSDVDRPQRIYEGNYVRSDDGTEIISTQELADNTIPGLSGAPVIDSDGRLIGLMSQKHGKFERLAGIEYAREILRTRAVGER